MKIDDLLKKLVEVKGSDLHIIAGNPPAMRVRGELSSMDGYPIFDPDTAKNLIYEVLTPSQIESFERDPTKRHELDFAYSIHGVGRFRCNVHKQRGTVGASMRALATFIPPLESLGLPESILSFTKIKKGLSLVTGPTGSGKSTTLAAIIDRINRTRHDHIITIEDPIEYLHKSQLSYVTQREVGESGDTLSFNNALKYALRQDPDVILIGEMRDYNTIGIAITSAETGHLVFGTLHTNSASQTVGRIVDVFPVDQQPQVRTQLASNIAGVISQILLPTADGKGRILACEIMRCNAAIRNNIRLNSIDGMYQAIQTGTQEGMQTMDQSLQELVKSGKVSYERALPFIRDDITKRALAPYAGRVKEPELPDIAAVSSPSSKPSQNEPPSDPPKTKGKAIIPPWEKP